MTCCTNESLYIIISKALLQQNYLQRLLVTQAALLKC